MRLTTSFLLEAVVRIGTGIAIAGLAGEAALLSHTFAFLHGTGTLAGDIGTLLLLLGITAGISLLPVCVTVATTPRTRVWTVLHVVLVSGFGGGLVLVGAILTLATGAEAWVFAGVAIAALLDILSARAISARSDPG